MQLTRKHAELKNTISTADFSRLNSAFSMSSNREEGFDCFQWPILPIMFGISSLLGTFLEKSKQRSPTLTFCVPILFQSCNYHGFHFFVVLVARFAVSSNHIVYSSILIGFSTEFIITYATENYIAELRKYLFSSLYVLFRMIDQTIYLILLSLPISATLPMPSSSLILVCDFKLLCKSLADLCAH